MLFSGYFVKLQKYLNAKWPPPVAAALTLVVCVASVCVGATFDFVDTPMGEVARALSLAYETPILVDGNADRKVTFHLENVGFLEGLAALCETQGLELAEEGGMYRIRLKQERGDNFFSMEDSLVSISVRDKDVLEFIREYAANSGLNILPSLRVSGRISGSLRGMPAESAFRALMTSQGYRVWRESGCLRVDMAPHPVGSAGFSPGQPGDSPQVLRDDSLYSVDFVQTNMAEALKQIANLAEMNLAIYGDLQENVNAKFENVPLNFLLDALFKGSRYAYTQDSSSIYVGERGAKNPLSITKLHVLKHVHSEKALQQLTRFLPSGNFIASEVKEQNALLLGGTIAEIASAEDVLNRIDIPTLQVNLSCIIVELKRGKSFEIGLHSGSSRKTAEADIGVRGFYDFLGSNVSRSGAYGTIGILPDRFEMELANLEESNKAEVLARPKLSTINGNKAELNVTNTVYYLVSQVSADGYPITDYRSFNDGISLELTPSVTEAGSITLEVSPEIKTAGRSTGDGPRDISTRNLKTTVVLKNGETFCLGGLRRKNKTEVRSAVPFLGSIPFIGRLFSYTSEEEDESELAIFITPEVIKFSQKSVAANAGSAGGKNAAVE